MKKVIIITRDGYEREACNVFHSQYLIVDTNGDAALKFDEPLFTDENHPFYDNEFDPWKHAGLSPGGTIQYTEQLLPVIYKAELESYGYTVEIPETDFLISKA